MEIGSIRCEVDVGETHSAYGCMPAAPMGFCDCRDCRNFAVQAQTWLRAPFFEWLERWGIDRWKPSEICCAGDEPEARPYWITYGVVGRIEGGEPLAHGPDGRLYTPQSIQFMGQQLNMESGSFLVPKDYFGNACFGIEVNFAGVPWVLPER